MPFDQLKADYEARKAKARGMGGPEKLAARKATGHMNARERLDALLDPGSFLESGLFAQGIRPEMRDRTPADGKVAGFGRIGGRPVAVVSNDFTVLGASSSAINGKKIRHVKDTATRNGLPLIFLGESSGARMPDRMGSAGRAMLAQDPYEYRRLRETPWVSALLGPCYGSSTWYSVLSDFLVMRKGALMSVASPRVTSLAISQPVDPEELGGWKLHSEVTGLVDAVAETDAEALQLVSRFLSYLPSHHKEAPPVAEVPPDAGLAARGMLDLLPESRTKVYDVRKVIAAISDPDSVFELKPRFGRSMVTALARLDGRSVGFIANNPLFKGGAIDVDACRKATNMLVLCDSFHIPIVFLVDQPGFLIGMEGERRWAPGRIMNWMTALQQVTVPKISIVLRKSYGQAYLNMGGGRNSHEVACWPTADFGFMDPATGVNVVYGLRRQDNPERFAQLQEELARDTSAWGLAGLYEVQSVFDPRDTRDYLIATLAVHRRGPSKGLGERHLANWPTSF